ncbi:MAG: hypothetical protein P4L55_21150 [Syntrophobacteraceae bacterium]|nr:hypothetical protein [Syntrophobacteraceae bacterium]
MEDDKQNEGKGLTRRQALKASGLALGGLAVGGALIGSERARADGQACSEVTNSDESCQDSCPPGPVCHWTSSARARRYSYFQNLPQTVLLERQSKVSDFTFSLWENYPEGYPDSMNYPKYDYADGSENPYARIDTCTQLPDCTFNSCNYRDDGY